MKRYNKRTVRAIVRLAIRLRNSGIPWNAIFRAVKKKYPAYTGSVESLGQLWRSYRDRMDTLLPKKDPNQEDVTEQTPIYRNELLTQNPNDQLTQVINKEINRQAAIKAVNMLEKIVELVKEQVKELKDGEAT